MSQPDENENSNGAVGAADIGETLATLLGESTEPPADAFSSAVQMACRVLGGASARVLIADYALTSLQELDGRDPTGERQAIEGTLAGRAFVRGEIVVSGDSPVVLFVPLAEGSERLGVLELTHASWSDDLRPLLGSVARVLVLLMISTRRYTDVVLRCRRREPLSRAAEMQWDLLPPLTCSTSLASVSGILEPAYSIGGDSFDFAFNPNRVEFSILDAVGHGISAVLLSVAAITSLRNARREGLGHEQAYAHTDEAIRTLFAPSTFVTGQLGSLDLVSGEMTWLNAGHPLPLLVRDGSFTGELSCSPSLPMGLGGSVVEIATERLQPGDRVLFYTDGVIETRSSDGERFGVDRLADLLVRASLDDVPPAETVRRLSESIMGYNVPCLTDDATLLLLCYHGTGTSDGARRMQPGLGTV